MESIKIPSRKGGARPGAGRPFLGTKKRVIMAFVLDPDFAAELRNTIQPHCRSQFAEAALRKALQDYHLQVACC